EASVINKGLLKNLDKLNATVNGDEASVINKDLLKNLDKLNATINGEASVVDKTLLNKDSLDKLTSFIGGSEKVNKTELHVDSATNVTVELTGEDVGRGLKLVVERLANNPVGDNLDASLKDKDLDFYNIHFVNAEGEVTQIKSEAWVTIPRDTAKEIVGVHYVATTGLSESLPFELLDYSVKFKVSHFSFYAVAYAAQATPNAEQSKAEAPKAEAPKAEAPKAEAPKAEAPKAESLPETGEKDAYLIFGAAALSILAGVGLVSTRRQEN
ncbi:LPXTG cell wall anchor domain-containing protein, partial [Aerococcaceae bacterium zg-ZUI334]|uniref:LPXTG cell wall anchor domain-containing protein n=1 Tax=Aerococcaceae bacterium zg-252 TaxID=2796928 RepID=UPI001B8DECDA|nr:LPXTG cell wall anchor domain-containing protein [Aerococcaceae bacterium zg-ZUI334]